MIEQKKKLRLEELQVDSFVTSSINDSATVKGGITLQGVCASGMPPACDTATQTNPGDVLCGTGDFFASCPFCATFTCPPPAGSADCTQSICIHPTNNGDYTCDGGYACGDSRAIC